MKMESICRDIEDSGLSQWYGKRGFHSVYEEGDGLFCLYTSKGPRLSDGGITEEYHGLSFADVEKHVS